MARALRGADRLRPPRAVRPGRRPRQHRPAGRGTPGRHPAGHDVRLRVRGGDAPLERPARHPRAGARRDPRGGAPRYGIRPAEARALPGAEGGVLPRRPPAGPGRRWASWGSTPGASIAVLRPPPEVTLYHRGALHRPLRRDPGAAAGGRARGPDRGPAPDRRSSARRWPAGRDRPRRGPVDGPSLVAAADLVVSAGRHHEPRGRRARRPRPTRPSRRASARSTAGSSREGRLRRLERPEDVALERRARGERPAPARPGVLLGPDSRSRRPLESPALVSRAPLNWSPRAFAHRVAQIAVDAGWSWRPTGWPSTSASTGTSPGATSGSSRRPSDRHRRQAGAFVATRFYTKWWRFTSLRDLQAIVLAAAASSLLVTAVLSPGGRTTSSPVPRGVLVFDLVLTLVLIGGARFAVRSVIERPPRSELVEQRPRGADLRRRRRRATRCCGR